MDQRAYDEQIMAQHNQIEQIRQRAHALHASVNQYYDGNKPYGYHLDMVANAVKEYGAEVCACADDVAPMLFGAYFHDSIEDARLTYNNVLNIAREYFDEEHALMAAEIAYALTNEKGRNRAERANDKYYEGIRLTPYAPLCKLADRLANYSYSQSCADQGNARMLDKYAAEMDHFLAQLESQTSDPRFSLPPKMVEKLKK